MDAKNKIWELWQAIKQVKNESIQGMDNLFQKVTDNKTTFRNALTAETNRAEAAEQTNAAAIANNKSAIDILNGDSTVNGSVKKAIKDVVGAAPEALNTLGEIATELTNHESAAAAISTAITNETTRAKAAEKANADAITALNNRIKIISITSSDYTALATKDANTLYCIPE